MSDTLIVEKDNIQVVQINETEILVIELLVTSPGESVPAIVKFDANPEIDAESLGSP